MAGGFRRLIDTATQSPGGMQATPVFHRESTPGGGPSIQAERDALRVEMRKKFETASTPKMKQHYSTLLQQLDANTTEDDVYDRILQDTGSVEEAEQALMRLRLGAEQRRHRIIPNKPQGR